MLFNFQLRDIEDIASTGVMLHGQVEKPQAPAHQQNRIYLNWYLLTDGLFWLNCAGQELFRYSDLILKFWNNQEPSPVPPYVCHPVNQLLFDLCDMLPEVLDPIPQHILRIIEPGGRTFRWSKKIEELACQDEADECIYERYLKAVLWADRRRLYAMYLNQDPRIWFWNDGSTLHIQWDNEGLEIQGYQPWASVRGSFQIPFEEFMNELSSFNGRLLQAMEERIAAIERSWKHPEVELDIAALHQGQRENSSVLSRALEARTTEKTPWDQVVEAIRFFEDSGYPLT